MAGIIFLRTAEFEHIVEFYTDRLGMEVWLEQPSITILRHENLLVGFQDQPEVRPDNDGLITFFYPDREQVDRMYALLTDRSITEPKENPRYRIYNFYAEDPEKRRLEFQYFLHELPAWG